MSGPRGFRGDEPPIRYNGGMKIKTPWRVAASLSVVMALTAACSPSDVEKTATDDTGAVAPSDAKAANAASADANALQGEGHDSTTYDPGGKYAGVVAAFDGKGTFSAQAAWAERQPTLLLFAASW